MLQVSASGAYVKPSRHTTPQRVVGSQSRPALPAAQPGAVPGVQQRLPAQAAGGGATAAAAAGTYTRAQVAAHASAASCWYIFAGQVFDLTAYLQSGRHPGAAALRGSVLQGKQPAGAHTPAAAPSGGSADVQLRGL